MPNFEANTEIITAGSPNNTLYLIAEGSVNATTGGRKFLLKKGDIVGIFDVTLPTYQCSYISAEKCQLIPYTFQDLNMLLQLFEKNADLRRLLIMSLTKNICKLITEYQASYDRCREIYRYIGYMINQYQKACTEMSLTSKSLPFMENYQAEWEQNSLPFFLEDYYTSMHKILTQAQYDVSASFLFGFFEKSSDDIQLIFSCFSKNSEVRERLCSYLINEDYLDVFDLYSNLYFRVKTAGLQNNVATVALKDMTEHMHKIPQIDTVLVTKRIDAFKQQDALTSVKENTEEAVSADDEKIKGELMSSFNTIMDYADTLPVAASEFRTLLDEFKKVSDRNATDKNVDTLRRRITKTFYILYNDIIHNAIKSDDIPVIVKMFLYFGYIDPELCGYHNAIALYKLAENFHGNKELGVYTFLEWLKEIYAGNKQPSRNEFEMDYTAYVRNMKRERKIDKTVEAEMLNDVSAKVVYELQNLFPTVNKITFGRLYTFCPILLEENILRPLDELLVTSEKVDDVLDQITNMDYSAFYHDSMFEEPSLNFKETLRLDIRPDVILMPNIGVKGIMWQEIEGMTRTTPARMILSVFHMENLTKTFIRMTGEFRWEMCKRTQGARWNDLSYHSLTSEYCDYIQFFAKNRDLSYEAKDKIKTTLKRCKNSFREMFIQDYITYMMYESTASCRLNKVARTILFRYCPFSKEVREVIRSNTIFHECLDKHRLRTAQETHHINQLITRYHNTGKPVPDEIQAQLELIDK